MTAACGSSDNPPPSNQALAIQASDRGDQKAAIILAKKDVAQFSAPDQCSPGTTLNCGTLALAYSALAEYQIRDGDKRGGEASFSGAKRALLMTDRANQASATGIVYRDVSEAFWKVGDRARAIAVFKEGRTAGGDMYLYTCSAAKAVEQDEKAKAAPAPEPASASPADPKLEPSPLPPGLRPGPAKAEPSPRT